MSSPNQRNRGAQLMLGELFPDSEDDSDYSAHSAVSEAFSFNTTNSSNSGDDHNMSISSNDTISSASNNDTNSTEEYDIPQAQNVSQGVDEGAAQRDEAGIAQRDADEDVILIETPIETINLCTQALPRMSQFRRPVAADEVIEIIDSPGVIRQPAPVRSRRNRRANAAPYASPPPNASNSSSHEGSLNATQTPAIRINCPVCFESVVSREPVSTICGHIFCKACLVQSLGTNKTCPMCRKKLTRTSFHPIHIG